MLLALMKDLKNESGIQVQLSAATQAVLETLKFGLDQLPKYNEDQLKQLKESIDNLPYRARRILPSWVAWGLGLGQSEWIVQVFAVLNVGVWLVLGWVLLRWLPPDSWSNLLRWGGVMFSHGMCMSVRNSLADAPGLLLVALTVAAVERGRKPTAVVALGAALLTKETSLLAGMALIPKRGSGRGAWAWALALGALAVMPFVAWLGYVHWQAGPNNDAGLGNFARPLAGLAEKIGVVLGEISAGKTAPEFIGSLLVVIALVTQAAFLLLRREPEKPWWRVGAGFAVLMLCVAQPVWEGYPGAATRVLLPMMLAFNVLVPRGRRWLAPPGGAVCLSWSWRFEVLPAQGGALSLVIGLAARRALQQLGVDGVQIKWPNDLVCAHGKLGGILIELRAEAGGPTQVVIGIGLNLHLDAALTAAVAAEGNRAAGLSLLSADLPSRSELVAALLACGIAGLREFERAGLAPFQAGYAQADALHGLPVVASGGAQTLQGTACGIDADGALLIQSAAGLQRVLSGDVSVRPQTQDASA
jgi:biotin-[acetyl-CoA-carboxylase] ligase BirA-like protein